MKKQLWIGACLLTLVFSGCGKGSDAYFEKAEQEMQEWESETEAAETERVETRGEEAGLECYVHVCGAVAEPGVYKLKAGSRVYEAIEMAGGLLENACADSINQAQEAFDGQMVKVPTEEEAQQQMEQAAGSAKEEDGLVNINTADTGELMTLPGIGASKAESILSYREENGSFASIEEIKNITGIKEGVYSKIKDYITVN